jgi:hypothetical protein
MKKILAVSFFSMPEDDVRPGETISDREFYTILGMICIVLSVFAAMMHAF